MTLIILKHGILADNNTDLLTLLCMHLCCFHITVVCDVNALGYLPIEGSTHAQQYPIA